MFREWAPHATAIYLIGETNGWERREAFRLKPLAGGVWELRLPVEALWHGMLYKLWIEWEGGAGERSPAYVRRVVQDDMTKLFTAQVWEPEKATSGNIRKPLPSSIL